MQLTDLPHLFVAGFGDEQAFFSRKGHSNLIYKALQLR